LIVAAPRAWRNLSFAKTSQQFVHTRLEAPLEEEGPAWPSRVLGLRDLDSAARDDPTLDAHVARIARGTRSSCAAVVGAPGKASTTRS
jgi:hypothetical protein